MEIAPDRGTEPQGLVTGPGVDSWQRTARSAQAGGEQADAGDRERHHARGDAPVGEICLLKNQATQTLAFCADAAVQLYGGMGFMRGVIVERIALPVSNRSPKHAVTRRGKPPAMPVDSSRFDRVVRS